MTSFLIGKIGDGIRKDSKPWANPEDSWEELINIFQYRGRLIRRCAYTTLGRLANGTPVMGLKTFENFGVGLQTLVAFDTTTAYEWNGTAFVLLPSVMPVVWSGTDSDFFWTTNYANAFWATNFKSGLNGVNVSSAVPGVGITTITTSSPHGFSNGETVLLIHLGGMVDLNGNTYVIQNVTPTAFDIPFMSVNAYTGGGIALNAFVTVAGQDGIRYYGDLTNGTGWANYNPPIDPDNVLAGALMIFPYRGYLVFLNTWEGNEVQVFNYPNRARWTQIGTPYYSPPAPVFPNIQGIDPLTARDDLFGRGGANDAPTNEAIVTAGFIRDVLIVEFERSTWRLRFVNNAQNPFVWERVNVELGSSCTFSQIPFDIGLMSISNRGITISDGNDAKRFDEKIPDEIFTIRQANQGLKRVYGIRTFRTRLCFWTFPSVENPDGIFPDKVLVYNYETQNWSFFDDCFTCFGYVYPLTGQSKTWNDLPDRWDSYGWLSWDGGTSQEGYEFIVAGNQQGYVLQLQEPTEDASGGVNQASLSITAVTAASPGVFTSPNNNLPQGTWIKLIGITGITSDDGVSLNGRNFKVVNLTVDPNDFSLIEFERIDGGFASGAGYSYNIDYVNLFVGSIQINIGTLVFKDPGVNGILVEAAGLGRGTINYTTGVITLLFTPAIGSTQVWIRIVSLDQNQGFSDPINTIGGYIPGGEIIKISGWSIKSKYFNFFKENKRGRLSRIDFYVDQTANGQFQCDIFADSSNVAINAPLSDNLLSNTVLTQRNPYQIASGDDAIFRLFCETQAQTLQFNMFLNDQQLATDPINASDLEIMALMVKFRDGGRLV